MRWYHYVAYFFGGAFLANTLPHLGNGISGHANFSLAHRCRTAIQEESISSLEGPGVSPEVGAADAEGILLLRCSSGRAQEDILCSRRL
jgi:hypothetical protein